MTIYVATDKQTNRSVMLCAECIKDHPEDDYRYADWFVGEPVPYDGTYADAVGNLEGRAPTCDACSEVITP